MSPFQFFSFFSKLKFQKVQRVSRVKFFRTMRVFQSSHFSFDFRKLINVYKGPPSIFFILQQTALSKNPKCPNNNFESFALFSLIYSADVGHSRLISGCSIRNQMSAAVSFVMPQIFLCCGMCHSPLPDWDVDANELVTVEVMAAQQNLQKATLEFELLRK